jgi:hypothetical protein
VRAGRGVPRLISEEVGPGAPPGSGAQPAPVPATITGWDEAWLADLDRQGQALSAAGQRQVRAELARLAGQIEASVAELAHLVCLPGPDGEGTGAWPTAGTRPAVVTGGVAGPEPRFPTDPSAAAAWAGFALRQSRTVADAAAQPGSSGLAQPVRALLAAQLAARLAEGYADPDQAPHIRSGVAGDFEHQWLKRTIGQLAAGRRPGNPFPSHPARRYAHAPRSAPSASLPGLLYVAPLSMQAAFWRTVLSRLIRALGGLYTYRVRQFNRVLAAIEALGRPLTAASAWKLAELGGPLAAPAGRPNAQLLDDLAYLTAMVRLSLHVTRDGSWDAAETGWDCSGSWSLAGAGYRAEAVRVAAAIAAATGHGDGYLKEEWNRLGLAAGPFCAWRSDEGSSTIVRSAGTSPSPLFAVQTGVVADPHSCAVRLLRVSEHGVVVSVDRFELYDEYYAGASWVLRDESVRVYDPDTGALRWRTEAGFLDLLGRMLCVLAGGEFTVCDLATGDPIPSPHIPEQVTVHRTRPSNGYFDRPLSAIREAAAAGVVYRASDGAIGCHDRGNGTALWRLPLDEIMPAEPAGSPRHEVWDMVPTPGRLYLLTDRGALICLAAG